MQPETIQMVFDQYHDDVTVGEVRETLKNAFKKLDSSNKLLRASQKVSSKQSHALFMLNESKKGVGFH